MSDVLTGILILGGFMTVSKVTDHILTRIETFIGKHTKNKEANNGKL